MFVCQRVYNINILKTLPRRFASHQAVESNCDWRLSDFWCSEDLALEVVTLPTHTWNLTWDRPAISPISALVLHPNWGATRMHFPDEGAGGKCNKDWITALWDFGTWSNMDSVPCFGLRRCRVEIMNYFSRWWSLWTGAPSELNSTTSNLLTV
jgi:hypothetical protein